MNFNFNNFNILDIINNKKIINLIIIDFNLSYNLITNNFINL